MKKVFVNMDRCIACRTCSAACDYSHWDRRPTIGYGELREDVRLPFICRHCEQPACLEACPQNAIRKRVLRKAKNQRAFVPVPLAHSLSRKPTRLRRRA